ncbi:SRPBCC domain-containing protein [Paraburkholderia guartelaensis]|uniref:SRPBCC domain-containing protein n=1 Tax=Paraburkholderia guartelaensis TaxID=2546446 RepID=UPI0038B9BE59
MASSSSPSCSSCVLVRPILLHRVSATEPFEFDSSDPAVAGTMTVRWVLEAAPGGTIATVIAENVPYGISQADHEIGMNSSLAHLAGYVESKH